MDLLFDPVIPPLTIYPRNPKMPVQKNILFIVNLSIIFKYWLYFPSPTSVSSHLFKLAKIIVVIIMKIN